MKYERISNKIFDSINLDVNEYNKMVTLLEALKNQLYRTSGKLFLLDVKNEYKHIIETNQSILKHLE